MAKVTKEEVIQQLQDRNIEFDGGASQKDLQVLLDESIARDGDVNSPGSTNTEDKANPVVQPLESVAIPVTVSRKEQCWNCKANDRRTPNRLDKNGHCGVCGFNKGELYNGNIEADKAAQRIELARAAEQQ